MEIEKILERFPNLSRGADYEVDLVLLKDGRKGIFKGNMKADPLSTIPLKEVLAYKVDNFIDFGLVPETKIAVFEGRIGCCQLFVEGITGQQAVNQKKFNPKYEEMQKLAIFDFVFNNCDRWFVNFLIEESGDIHAIDNAGCFQNRDTSSCTISYIIGQKFTTSNVNLIKKLHKNCKELCELMLDFEYETLESNKIKARECISDSVRLSVNHIYVLAGTLGIVDNINHQHGLIAPEELNIDINISKG